MVGHALDHVGREEILLGQAEEEVRALEGFGHGHVFGQGELRLVLVQIRASLVQDALGVEHADIGGIDAELSGAVQGLAGADGLGVRADGCGCVLC